MNLYVVNLDRAPERLADTKRLFDEAGLSFVRIPGVDGAALPPAERRRTCPPVRFYLANGYRALPGEIGCVLSHLAAWKAAFAGGEALAAVFEDDVSFDAGGLRAALASAERDNDPAVPTVWLLQSRVPPPPPDLGGRAWFDILETDDAGNVFWTSSYVLNAAAARRLAEILTPMCNVADAWSAFARCGVRVLAMARPCCGQRETVSTIERKEGFLWRQAWFRRFHWTKWRFAIRVDLFLKRLEGKRFPS
ncbi:MAG: glycosyltransferase family 25 protein [Kiritimatiellae bacterium]|nr:glycosyltransferase family 25 protein [Kiritimatiellia bacterium]